MRRAGRGGAEVVEDEVAVGDGVDRVRRDARRSRARRRPSARSVSKLTPASAPAPSGSSSTCERTKRKRSRSRREHPDVGQQVVAEVDGLGALQVRVAGQRPVEVRARRRRAARASGPRRARTASSAASRTNSATSVTTWSLRERAVCSLPPTGPAISVRRRSIAMWMSSSSVAEREAAAAQLGLDRVEPGEQRVAVVVADDPARGEHPRVGARLGDVVGPQAPVDVERAVERREDGVLRLGEARHGRRVYGERSGRACERRVRRARSAAAPATRSTWPSVISGKNGSASERAATSSQTGNSPSRWPKRSR